MHKELIGPFVGGGVTGILNFQDFCKFRMGSILLNKGSLMNDIIKTWLSYLALNQRETAVIT